MAKHRDFHGWTKCPHCNRLGFSWGRVTFKPGDNAVVIVIENANGKGDLIAATIDAVFRFPTAEQACLAAEDAARVGGLGAELNATPGEAKR